MASIPENLIAAFGSPGEITEDLYHELQRPEDGCLQQVTNQHEGQGVQEVQSTVDTEARVDAFGINSSTS